MPSSSQAKYAITYVLITSVVLLLLNFITAASTRNLVYQSNYTSMQDKVQLLSSSLSGLDSVTEENVTQSMDMLANLNSTRIVVTDPNGLVVYDSLAGEDAAPWYFLLPEVVDALSGNDVFFCRYTGQAVESHAAAPVMSYDDPIGAVYLMEYDTDQGALITSLEDNLLRISIILEVVVVVASFLFSSAFSRRMNRVLQSIRIVREGDYTHNLEMKGHDELRQLSEEFNQLTARLHEADQRHRQFISDASHELKTPLASIKLLSDSILQNQMDLETTREFVQDIGNEADRLTRLSAKLLELTKLDAQVIDQREIVDVSDTASVVLKMLRPQILQKKLCLQQTLPVGGTILMLEDDLYQIIFNLVENGIKYNHTGGLLAVSVEIGQEQVSLTVSDSGVGIPEESMDHIFERFYRVDKARSRKAGGAGLGLSIVHDMVARNDGRIQVRHRQPEGTQFQVTFPLFAIEEDAE